MKQFMSLGENFTFSVKSFYCMRQIVLFGYLHLIIQTPICVRSESVVEMYIVNLNFAVYTFLISYLLRNGCPTIG